METREQDLDYTQQERARRNTNSIVIIPALQLQTAVACNNEHPSIRIPIIPLSEDEEPKDTNAFLFTGLK